MILEIRQYLEFQILQSNGLIFQTHVVEVTERNVEIARAVLPSNTHSFRFYEVASVTLPSDGERLVGDPKNHSCTYYIEQDQDSAPKKKELGLSPDVEEVFESFNQIANEEAQRRRLRSW
jgi:hypothetical protein